jgi:hypothetical protein
MRARSIRKHAQARIAFFLLLYVVGSETQSAPAEIDEFYFQKSQEEFRQRFQGDAVDVERKCCNFVVEPTVGIDDRQFSWSPRTNPQ